MPFFQGVICDKCGKPVHYSVDECRECKGERFNIAYLRSLGRYTGNLQNIILALKLSNAFKAADYLGEKMADMISDRTNSSNIVVTYIPIKRSKQALRGYNQAELLSSVLAKTAGLSLQRLLVKRKNTFDQSGLDKKHRKQNVKNAYICVSRRKVDGYTIVLVDDVFTSGSTMNEAAKTLLESGAKEVIGVTAARTLLSL